MIQKRKLFQTLVTEIGLGCWQLGGDWGEVSDAEALEILRASHEAGVRFLDTAAGYGAGRSERLIGQFLKEQSEAVFVATKIGRKEASEAHLRTGVENSLQRLGVETLDLIQLHCWTMEHLRQHVVWETLRDLQKEGKIRQFGASVESVEEARFCMAQEGMVSLQIIFNLFRQHPRDEFFAEAQAKGVALIVRVPLASGLLSGKFCAETRFGAGDHRNYNKDGAAFHVGETFGGLTFEKGLELVEQLKSLLPGEPPLAALALRWILDHDAVTTVIPGASSIRQAVANAEASRLPALPVELHQKLAEFYRNQVAPHVRGQY
ncbi:MAG: aldo/keto reductase [Blastochloris sp.]|nr:aldo/keto reductase [Blastochloris sp.]